MKLRSIVCVLFCSLLLACSQNNNTFHDTHSNTINESQLRGKWIVINYWADWCGSCTEEMPELNRFYKDNKDQNIVLYGVDYDHATTDRLKQLINKHHIQYPILIEDPAVIFKLDVAGIVPTTFIINPKGEVVKTIQGPTSAKALSNLLVALKNKNEK